jgi:hypothetical protein
LESLKALEDSSLAGLGQAREGEHADLIRDMVPSSRSPLRLPTRSFMVFQRQEETRRDRERLK